MTEQKENGDFLFSVPSGEPIQIEPFMYAIIGQTQFSGKSTLLKRLATWAVKEGYKVLIFDTKETVEDYEGFGREIPPCLRDTTDSFVLIGLLESIFRRKLTTYYATLSRLTDGTRTVEEIISKAKELEKKTRSGWMRDAFRTLYDLLERLKAEMDKIETVPKLELHEGINRMTINNFSQEAQQLIVKNAFEDALRIYGKNLIIVLDEAFKFIPQGYSSPASQAVMNVMTQGAKTGLYVWISTQFLATTDKDPLKACAFKFLGTQDHVTEIKHTLDLIPEVKGKYDKNDIMRLGLGHWILVRKRPRDVRIVYALPDGVPGEYGKLVAQGKMKPEEIRDQFLKPKEYSFIKMLKEKPISLGRKAKFYPELIVKEVQKLRRELTSVLNDKKILEESLNKLRSENKSAKDRIKNLEVFVAGLRSERKIDREKIKNLKQDLKDYEDLKGVLAKIVQPSPILERMTDQQDLKVSTNRPTLEVKISRRELTLTDKDLHGKIAILYSEGVFDNKWFSVSDVMRGFQSHAWPRDPRISKALDEFTRWGFFTKKMAGRKPIYQVLRTRDEAKKAGLLKVQEGV